MLQQVRAGSSSNMQLSHGHEVGICAHVEDACRCCIQEHITDYDPWFYVNASSNHNILAQTLHALLELFVNLAPNHQLMPLTCMYHTYLV